MGGGWGGGYETGGPVRRSLVEALGALVGTAPFPEAVSHT